MTLIIKLNDINDNTPIFTQQHGYNFYGNSTGIIGQVMQKVKTGFCIYIFALN